MFIIRLHRKFSDSRLKGRVGQLQGAPAVPCMILLLIPHGHISAGSPCEVASPLTHSSFVFLTFLENKLFCQQGQLTCPGGSLLQVICVGAQQSPAKVQKQLQELRAAGLSNGLASHSEEGKFLSSFAHTWN